MEIKALSLLYRYALHLSLFNPEPFCETLKKETHHLLIFMLFETHTSFSSVEHRSLISEGHSGCSLQYAMRYQNDKKDTPVLYLKSRDSFT